MVWSQPPVVEQSDKGSQEVAPRAHGVTGGTTHWGVRCRLVLPPAPAGHGRRSRPLALSPGPGFFFGGGSPPALGVLWAGGESTSRDQFWDSQKKAAGAVTQR